MIKWQNRDIRITPCRSRRPRSPLDFSFSGLKSAVLQLIDRENKKGEELNKEDLSYAFQEAALDTLLKKTMQAVKEFKPKQVVLAGGVRGEFPPA